MCDVWPEQRWVFALALKVLSVLVTVQQSELLHHHAPCAVKGHKRCILDGQEDCCIRHEHHQEHALCSSCKVHLSTHALDVSRQPVK